MKVEREIIHKYIKENWGNPDIYIPLLTLENLESIENTFSFQLWNLKRESRFFLKLLWIRLKHFLGFLK